MDALLARVVQSSRLKQLLTGFLDLTNGATAERRVTPEVVEAFGSLLVAKLKNGTTEFRQAYVPLLIDQVVPAPGKVSIVGSVKAVEHAITGSLERPATVVPRAVQEWCSTQSAANQSRAKFPQLSEFTGHFSKFAGQAGSIRRLTIWRGPYFSATGIITAGNFTRLAAVVEFGRAVPPSGSAIKYPR